MSVLACDRNGCENIMCDRISHEHGYICNECFKELVEFGASRNWLTPLFIISFMNSPKIKNYELSMLDPSKKYFEKIFICER